MYQVIIATSERAAIILDGIAMDRAAPSRIISLARTAEPRRPQAAAQAQDLTMEDITPRLVLLNRQRRWQGAEAADLDHQAVIRAYKERQLSIHECTRRFAARSDTVITEILTSHDIPFAQSRPSRSSPGQPLARHPLGQTRRTAHRASASLAGQKPGSGS